jgi:peptidoglycan/LPS O-acetylase OafA/YrhL
VTRIVPALVVCLLVTITAYVVLIPASWLSSLTERTAIAAFAGLSNIVLAFNDDAYFAPVSEYNPFLHTWSLGVEEQFYLIFPFLLFFHGRSRANAAAEKRSLTLIAATGTVSLMICAILPRYSEQFAFYLLPSRFWELALGMILALTFGQWSKRIGYMSANGFGIIAALLIVALVASLAISETAGFPFPLPLIPAAATALAIMLVCSNTTHGFARSVASAPLVWTGLRSYSLYLWHWPVFVLMRWTSGLETPAQQLIAVAVTFALGHLSYRFVEQPFRVSQSLRARPRWIVACGGVALSAVAALSAIVLVKGQPALSISKTASGRWQASETAPLLAGPRGCRLLATSRPLANGKLTIWKRTGCPAPAPLGRIFAIGNSHALAYAPMLRQFTLDTGYETRLYFRSGCAFLALNAPMTELKGYSAYLAAAQRRLRTEMTPRDILFMPSLRLDQGENQWGKAKQFTDERRTLAAMTEARTVLQELGDETGARLVFEAPKPILPSPPYRCADWYTAGNPVCDAGLSISRQAMEAQRAPVLALMRELGRDNDRVTIWDPVPRLCSRAWCNAFDGNRPIFFDRHHVSQHGNAMLRERFTTGFVDLLKAASPAGQARMTAGKASK